MANEKLSQKDTITDRSLITTIITLSGGALKQISSLNLFGGRVPATDGATLDAIETKTDFIAVTQPVDLDTIESNVTTNNGKNTFPAADATTVSNITATTAIDLDNIDEDAQWVEAAGDISRATGDISLTAGTVGANGFVFPATQVASADANTLDDYEEGTFTPTIQDSSLSDGEGQTYASQSGTYQKVGNWVNFKIYLFISSIGTLSVGETANIGGLPFAAESPSSTHASAYCGSGVQLNITAGYTPSGIINPSATYITMNLWDSSGGTSGLMVSEISGDGELILSGSYKI